MKITGAEEQGSFVINLSGRMDAATVSQFTDFVQDNEDHDSGQVVVNMVGLEYISSAGLRGLLAYGKGVEGKNGSLRLCGLKGLVKEVFELSGFDKIFTIVTDIDEAYGHLQ